MPLRASQLVLAALLLPAAASAQITLQAGAGIPYVPGRTAAYDVENTDGVDTAALDAIVAQSGGGQTWDFTGLTVTDLFYLVTEVFEGAVGPGASDPPTNAATSTYRIRLGFEGEVGEDPIYLYYRAGGDGLRRLGSIVTLLVDGEEVPGIVETYAPDGILQGPPSYTFGDAWQSTTVEGAGGEYTTAYEVDGWGQVVVPGVASPVPALRLKWTHTATANPTVTDVVYEFRTGAGVMIYLDTDETGLFEPSAQIAIGIGEAETAVEAPAGTGGYALHTPRPNPARGLVSLDVKAPRATVATVGVVDVLGRQVVEARPVALAAGGGLVRVDVGGLPAGTYLVRLEVDGRTLTRALTVAR